MGLSAAVETDSTGLADGQTGEAWPEFSIPAADRSLLLAQQLR